MIPEQRKRAGSAVRARIRELHTTAAKVAADAGVGETTLRALMRGSRWPSLETRERVTAALGWPRGELARRAILNYEEQVRAIPTRVLLSELERRCGAFGS